jgi:glycosyltransferase involved in cell wall biosynthesis
LVCPPEDPAALAQAVRHLVAMPQAEREKMGQAGRDTFLANYTRQVLLERYEKLLVQVASGGHRKSVSKVLAGIKRKT